MQEINQTWHCGKRYQVLFLTIKTDMALMVLESTWDTHFQMTCLDMIISKAREIDPHFCFIAEELNPKNDCNTRSLGYNMFIGSGFWHEPRYKERYLHSFMYNTNKLACPIFACGETHDTPRIAAREGGLKLSKMLTILNMFVPNTVPFINSGQELYEIQPMNTGLDARPNEQYLLDTTDRYFGKLALFDKYAFHYLNPMRWDIPDNLELVSKIREHYISTISDITHFVPIYFDLEDAPVIGFSFIEHSKRGENKDNVLMIFANTDPFTTTNTTALLDDLREISGNTANTAKLLFSQFEDMDELLHFDLNKNLNLRLNPGEVRIIKL